MTIGKPLVALIALLVGAEGALPMSSQAEWSTIEVGEVLSFRIPSGMHEKEVQPIDSIVGLIEGKGCEITYDYGRFSETIDAYRDYPHFSVKDRRYGSRRAQEARFEDPEGSPDLPFVRLLRIDDKDPNAFVLRVSCASDSVCSIADAIFDSIDFK